MRTILIYLFLSLGATVASSQMLSYEVHRGGKNIGNMNVLRLLTDSTETVEISSSVQFKILISFVVEYELKEHFKNDVLIKGEGFNTLNGSIQKEYNIKKRDRSYNLKLGDTPNNINETSIGYTVSQIYFDEPKDGQRVFSQHFAQYLTFEKVGKHQYKLQSPDGVNHYQYENGICTEVEVSRDFATVQFIMKPESYAIVKNNADTLRNK